MAWSWRRRRRRCRRRRNCGWSGTQQQHSTDHTKRTKKFLDTKVTVAGVKLNNNTALTIQSERSFLDSKPDEFPRNITKMRRKFAEKWRNCGWSETRQQHSKHETKRTVILYDVKTYEFETKRRIRRIFGNNHENEEYITATLWLERCFDNNTEVRNRRKNRLEMFVQMGTTLS